MSRIRRQLRSLVWHTPVADEVDADLDFHLEMRTREYVERGMSRDQAEAEARRRFGDIERVKARCRTIARGRERRMRIEEYLEDWRQDLLFAARQLAARPGFALTMVLTLALGIGANTAVFSAVDSVLFRALPYEESARIVTLWQTEPARGIERDPVSPGNFLEWRDRNDTFHRMAAIEPYSMDLTGRGDLQNLPTWLVSEGFFEIMGVRPLLGRTFVPEEYEAGDGGGAGPRRPGGRVVVLGHRLWRQRFGADPGIVGSTLILDDEGFTVVGVMPQGFAYPRGREVWRPRITSEDERGMRSRNWLRVVARLGSDVTLAQGRADMDRVAVQLAAEYPDTNAGVGVGVQPLKEQIVGRVRTPLLVLLGAVGLVLLIACTNVAGLLLARSAQRERELAIRVAVGARRGRLVRQLLGESALYGVLGAAGGVLLAYWSIRGLDALAAGQLPRVERLVLDLRVLFFALSISALTVLLFGFGPALRFSRPDVHSSLKEGAPAARAGHTPFGVRRLLVAGQIAMTLVLLVGAGLLTRSFIELTRVDPGFAFTNRLAVSVHIWDRYPEPEERISYFQEAFSRVAALPGVEAVGAASAVPFGRSSIEMERPFLTEAHTAEDTGSNPRAFVTYVTPGYFSALGLHLLNGRSIGPTDALDAPPVAVVSESVARRHWPGADPVGERIVVPGEFDDGFIEIVGVVRDVRHDRLDAEPWPEIYLAQFQDGFGSMTIVVRTAGPAAAALGPVQRELWSVNSQQTLYSADTLPALLAASLRERRFILFLLSTFAILSLLLSGIGVYGLVSFTTQQRSGEIGVRKAVGARAADILTLVLRGSLGLGFTGIVLGLAAALALTRLLRSMLFEVAADDPLTLVGGSLLLAALTAVATAIPASRAAGVDPMAVLRSE